MIPAVTTGAPRQLMPTDACAAHRKSANATGSTISLFSSLIMVASNLEPQVIVGGYGKYFAKCTCGWATRAMPLDVSRKRGAAC
jgi:hypothetical protein